MANKNQQLFLKVVRQHVNYDAFGNRISEVYRNASGTVVGAGTPGSIQMLFGFTGRDWDTDSELQYNRARWFDPKTGRWLSQDPISFAAGDANLYRYVGNDATYATDPSGLEEWYNDSGWDYVNPISWEGWVGDGIGSGIGWIGNFGRNWGNDEKVKRIRKDLQVRDALSGNFRSNMDYCRLPETQFQVVDGLARGNVEWLASGGMFATGGAGGLGDDIIRGGKNVTPRSVPRAHVIGVPESSDVVTLWKAPPKGRTGLAGEVAEGFAAKNYPGDGPYFATDKSLSTQNFQAYPGYQNGLQEINIPRAKFDELVYDGIIQIDGHYARGRSWHVPADKLCEFNEAIKLGPPNIYHPQ